mmetsp:Transcript_11092/g.13862  ORF Transcript_11092/g.13862 Transcript_11092/m.13862 type:complete len:184 (-) Transcript_11092:690-1241(-)|eukprot:CAMPEP_0204822292 /NCGR_PEP_ID=MMETSP1346-20131115/471_1 /ASSEMBLY_ACC=CAM_ASM_000771 /TAXON_ID=215587 /ORGANISM="Aplanochytrium stocchinoi, Strain GSBS06" /LENGTH=183 /DNA_ID=CAMNT_0051948407 /DNA_START=241 /DNA_END=792 /DNA_ORIENTATION=-
MGAGGSHDEGLRPDEVDDLVEFSGFTKHDVEKLYSRFRKLDRQGVGFITRAELLKIPELAMNPLNNRVMIYFGGEDKDRINFKEFVQYLSTFNKSATRVEKARAVFNIFDVDEDGYISSGELYDILKSMVDDNIEDAQIKLIVARIIQEADEDLDGKLSFHEFYATLLGPRLEKELTISWEDE